MPLPVAAAESGYDVLSLLPPTERLMTLASEKAGEYRNGSPFPHIALDDFLPVEVADSMLSAFPSAASGPWVKTEIAQEKKLWASNEAVMPPAIRNALYAFNTSTFLSFLEALTGIQGLIPDPYFEGGGMHQIVRGGKLGVHLDFNKYPKLKLDRCLNVLLYLNKDWKDEYGGHLELWDAGKSACVKRIAPVFNRCVIFRTSGKSYHGHPKPLTCPEGQSRKSVALYYYIAGAERELARGTEWLETEDKSAAQRAKEGVKALVRELTPPIVYRTARKALFRLGG